LWDSKEYIARIKPQLKSFMSASPRLPFPYRPEADIVASHLQRLSGALDWAAAAQAAQPWVKAVRKHPPPFWAMESLLKEYPISSAEGLALMRLAEALLRVPDTETAIALTADQLGRANFNDASDGAMARLSRSAIGLSKKFLPTSTSSGQAEQAGLMGKLGARTVVAATLRAVQLLGRQFVLGQTIMDALKEANAARRKSKNLRFSYDMLGEGARTELDALRYLESYINAIKSIAFGTRSDVACEKNDGISIKLSALHPRYEDAQHARVMAELVPRVWGLCEQAALANINLTIDAEQTPGLAWEAVKLLHQAGVPEGALQLLHGPGETVGAALVAAPGVAGVVFTGSTQVAKLINRTLAAKDGPITPLIAETGGINAMLVDSTALPEQVVDAVLQSAFRSAGQRCSALRLLYLHESIADPVIEMIQGAVQELVLGNPAELSTDVGPVIDRAALEHIQNHLLRLSAASKDLVTEKLPLQSAIYSIANMIPPAAFEVSSLAQVKDEIFGPVLQIVRWGSGALSTPEAVIAQINALGYGLTLGLQTRIDSRAQSLATAAHVGNIYVNRNMIGAVVGVQPFGGEGLSGTGPKAGGPHYLYRFVAEQTVTVNTTAAGGNAALLATA
jgi:hypothetical protein